jgi:hypothetical protein
MARTKKTSHPSTTSRRPTSKRLPAMSVSRKVLTQPKPARRDRHGRGDLETPDPQTAELSDSESDLSAPPSSRETSPHLPDNHNLNKVSKSYYKLLITVNLTPTQWCYSCNNSGNTIGCSTCCRYVCFHCLPALRDIPGFELKGLIFKCPVCHRKDRTTRGGAYLVRFVLFIQLLHSFDDYLGFLPTRRFPLLFEANRFHRSALQHPERCHQYIPSRAPHIHSAVTSPFLTSRHHDGCIPSTILYHIYWAARMGRR